jgi:hypothetical protein
MPKMSQKQTRGGPHGRARHSFDHAGSFDLENRLTDLQFAHESRATREREWVASLPRNAPILVIAHVLDPTWDELLQEETHSDSVFLRCRTEGLPASASRTRSGALAVHLICPLGIADIPWNTVIGVLENKGTLLEANGEGLTQEERRCFFPLRRTTIVALNILCQGYLALWLKICEECTPEEPDQFCDLAVDGEQCKSLKRELKELGFSPPPLLLRTDVGGMEFFQQVQDPSWWFLGEGETPGADAEWTRALESKIKSEMGLSSLSKPKHSSLLALLKALEGGRPIRNPALVLGVFNELNQALEKE